MVKCLPGSSATPLILFLWENTGPTHLDLFKPTSLAMPVRHRPGRSSSVTLWPVEETDFLPVSFLMAVGVCTLWLAQMGKMHFSLWRPWCLVAILIQYVPIILFCVLLPNPRSPKKPKKAQRAFYCIKEVWDLSLGQRNVAIGHPARLSATGGLFLSLEMYFPILCIFSSQGKVYWERAPTKSNLHDHLFSIFPFLLFQLFVLG